MKLQDFNFNLPEELIAKYPLSNRTESRLLCLDEGQIKHRSFADLPDLLDSGDLLVLNNTRVIPARLFAKKLTGAKIEILVERILSENDAYAHVKSNKSLNLPCRVILTNGIEVTIWDREGFLFRLEFHTSKTVQEVLTEIGHIPTPNYMLRPSEEIDYERYQTVYATKEGAVAAPTAGLHFDDALFKRLEEKGVRKTFITLHVGAGTFKPVTVENIFDHQMHPEEFEVSQEVCDLVNETKSSGGRIIAVGTTSVRALETVMRDKDYLTPASDETNIFISPGFRFRCIDGLITNFHLPKSTLLMLVCAVGGYSEVMASYEEAVKNGYRFYSYGDAMFVFRKDK
jgi:S-adenosylmethionine:tRNA ribosyltransferase-isomerase